jgi:hypothetical protein
MRIFDFVIKTGPLANVQAFRHVHPFSLRPK